MRRVLGKLRREVLSSRHGSKFGRTCANYEGLVEPESGGAAKDPRID